MKFTSIATIAFLAANSLAQDLNVVSVISDFYPSETPNIPAASSTALASALNAVRTSWDGSPQKTSAIQAIYSAAPESFKESISRGENYAGITGQEWYTKSVPPSAQSAVHAYAEAVLSAASSVVGAPASSTSKAGGAKETGKIFAGVIGVFGAVVAAL